MLDLLDIRKQIDSIDGQMVALFEKRMELCAQVAEYKIQNGKEVLDRKREEEKLEALAKLATGSFNQVGVQELFRQIMAMSRKLQYRQMNQRGVEDKIVFRRFPCREPGWFFRAWKERTVLLPCTVFSENPLRAIM